MNDRNGTTLRVGDPPLYAVGSRKYLVILLGPTAEGCTGRASPGRYRHRANPRG